MFNRIKGWFYGWGNTPRKAFDDPLLPGQADFIEQEGIRVSTWNYEYSRSKNESVTVCPCCRAKMSPGLGHGQGSKCRRCGAVRVTWGAALYYLDAEPTENEMLIFKDEKRRREEFARRYDIF